MISQPSRWKKLSDRITKKIKKAVITNEEI